MDLGTFLSIAGLISVPLGCFFYWKAKRDAQTAATSTHVLGLVLERMALLKLVRDNHQNLTGVEDHRDTGFRFRIVDPEPSPPADDTFTSSIPTIRLLKEQIDGRIQAEQAAAMWQERAHNLEADAERLLELLVPSSRKGRARYHWWPGKHKH